MQVIEAEYEIVTPMFIGGADKEDKPEIRPPSVKGALRFWWRALQWGKYLAKADNNIEAALKKLHKNEAELFGAAVNETSGGQGKILLKIKGIPARLADTSEPLKGEIYLLGQALYTSGNQKKGIAAKYLRAALAPKQKFKVILKLSNDVDVQPIIDTLLIFGLLGDLGSRSRRGFGSIAIQRLGKEKFQFNSDKEYHAAINAILGRIEPAPAMPIFTAINKEMKIVQAGSHKKYPELLGELGAKYQQARENAGEGRARVPFGLPLAGKGNIFSDTKNRRSSPLLMHIHPIGNSFVAIISFIPSNFHPAYADEGGEQLAFYQVLQDYLEPMTEVYP